VAAFSASAQPTANGIQLSVTSSAPLRYQSAFTNYKPFQKVDVGNWKALNDQVRTSAAARAMPMAFSPHANPTPPATTVMPMPRMDHGDRK